MRLRGSCQLDIPGALLPLLLLCLVSCTCSKALEADEGLPGRLSDSLSCRITAPCSPCLALRSWEDALCKLTGATRRLLCSTKQRGDQAAVMLPWPIPDSATLVLEGGSSSLALPSWDLLIAQACEISGDKPLLLLLPGESEHSAGSVQSSSTAKHAHETSEASMLLLPRALRLLVWDTWRRRASEVGRRAEEVADTPAEEASESGEAEVMVREHTLVHSHMSLFHFELIMLALLGVALPLVYWRKIRVRHL